MSRVLAVDWGTRRVGLAVSDPTGLLARPLPTLSVRGARHAEELVTETARREEADLVVLGLPLNMDGSAGDSAARARALGAALVRAGFSVDYVDERLSSEEAVLYLRERGETRPPKTRVDQIAALLLLQEYLETRLPSRPAANGESGNA